jgi:hypothetical protein
MRRQGVPGERGSEVDVKDRSGKITPVPAAEFFRDYFAESAGMRRLGRLAEGSTIKKRTTMWPDGTKQVDEDLAWDDDGKAKKESAGMPRLSKLVEADLSGGRYATITINGNRQYVLAVDGTHLKFSRDGERWGVPMHIAQLTQHPNAADFKSAEGIKAAGRRLERWLKEPLPVELGTYGAA